WIFLVKNGGIYEGVFKTYSPKCDLVLDAAHRKTAESSLGPKREDILESILFKSSDFVMVHFKDMDTNYARRDAFTDSAISAKVNGEHKEKDLEPWDGGETSATEELEALETDVSNGWDPNDMFRYNEENYGVISTYDSSLSSYTVPLERDNSEEFLKREARATQLAEEIESSAQYKARVALENDERTEEEKYTAVQRNANEREGHGVNTRESKYVPPGGRNRDVLSWGSGRQNSPRMGQSGSGPPISRSGSHTSDFSPNSGADQRVVNGGPPRMSPKAQRHPRGHRVSTGRGTISSGLEFVSHNAPGEASTTAVARGSPSGGTWSSVVSGVPRLSPKTHRPRSPRQSSTPAGPALPSPQPGTIPTESVAMPVPAASPTPATFQLMEQLLSTFSKTNIFHPVFLMCGAFCFAVPNMPQQRQDQHHQSTMMHPASAAGPPIVATPPAYSTQYVAYSPQQFPNQPLVQHVPHYQSQHPHVYSPVIQGNARMMAPPTHAQPGLVSSSATQYGAHEQTHAMYVSTGSLAQQYAHPNATLHPHPPHPQPSATPTGQQQSQHAGSHPAPSPVQHHQHQAAQALHLANPQQQSAIYHAGLAPTPPSMTPGSNTQSPQNSFPTAQQTVFTIHPSHVQPAYTNPPHMAHVPQAHVQSGMVPSHPTAHAPMMLMTTQPPGGPQAAIAQSALQPIPVSTTTHFPYMTHPSVQAHHQQQL
uniref:Ataxin 2 n=1 Tax=Chrysolophus pictus TaxID=9089 RepID=A0A8C3LCB3_CHRPC